jgi:hypothetical protein
MATFRDKSYLNIYFSQAWPKLALSALDQTKNDLTG